MKKYIAVILVLSMCLVGGYVWSFNNKEIPKDEIAFIDNVMSDEEDVVDDLEYEVETFDIVEEEIEVTQEEEDSEEIVVTNTTVISNDVNSNSVSSNTTTSNNTTSSNSTNSSTTSSNNATASTSSNNNVVTETAKTESSNTTNNTVQTEEVITQEPVVETVDTGYEEAMKEVEYATYNECFNAGMEASMKDTVNILGFDVKELYYGGKIIGYKLVLRYENPLN